MGWFNDFRNKYPFTDFHELNLSWFLEEFITLKEEVKNFYTEFSKKIKEEVDTWLDEHPEATTTVMDGSITKVKLNEVLADEVNIATKNYLTVAEMKEAGADILYPGTYAKTAGYYNANDNGGAFYEIVEDASENAYFEELDNGYFARLIYNDYINASQVGAVLDGVADDTAKITEALKYANVIFPTGSSVKLNNLYIPDFKEVDFNGSFVDTDHYAIVCGATLEHGYVRNISIRNAHFLVPNVGGAGLHTYGGIYLEGAIKANIYNCELANPFSGADFAYIRNSFNCTIDNCYCGTGNSTEYENSTGISFYAGTAIIAGSDNLTNNAVRNSLIQHVTYGISIDSTNGLTDTCIIDNVGFSHVNTGINIVGGANRNRNILLNTMRCEFSDYGIQNTGRLNVNGIYMTRISTAGILNSGYLTVTGEVEFYNPDTPAPLYSNSGKINASGSYPNLLGNATLQNTGYYTAPYLKGENDGNIFAINKYIKTVTGTSGSAGGSVTVDYPSGFDRSNALVIGKQIYRTNYTYVSDDASITVTLAANNIIVNTSTTDSTTFGRGFEVFIVDKNM